MGGMAIPVSARAGNGSLEFDGAFVTLRRNTLAARVTGGGTKRIPINQITAVVFQPAKLAPGYIRFVLAGTIEVNPPFGARSFRATSDENALVFPRRCQPEMEAVRDAIERAIADRQ